MPAPQFVPLTLDEFRKLVERFDFSARRIDAVHMHHTWRPRQVEFRGLASILGMWKYHTETNGWSDIAQHVTIDPQGIIWTGRSWKQPPASSGGHNGTSRVGPFMFEMIGDFDAGKEKLQGAQRASVIGVITAIQKKNGLRPNTLRFHRQLGSPKTCPGSGLSYEEILGEVTSAHTTFAIAAPPTGTRALAARSVKGKRAAPAPEPTSVFVIDESRIASALAVSGTTMRAVDASDAGMELVEDESSLDVSVARQQGMVERAPGARDASATLDAAALERLRPHVVNLVQGEFIPTGIYQTSAADVDKIFGEHIARWTDAWKQKQAEHVADPKHHAAPKPLQLMLWAHGGLVSEKSGLSGAARALDWWKANGVYPIYFVWETGLMESVAQIVSGVGNKAPDVASRDLWDYTTDPLVERLSRPLGSSLWSGMKRSAERSSAAGGGARYVAKHVAALVARAKKEKIPLHVHAAGHSAGSIFHSYFVPALTDLDVTLESLHFLAPAVRIDTFLAHLEGLVTDRKKIKQFDMFTMSRDWERADNCAKVYRKSLLYLVSLAFEPESKTPILGLEESLRASAQCQQIFGLNGQAATGGELILSKSVAQSGRYASRATAHGDFDDDPATMNSLIRRVLGVDDVTPIVEHEAVVGARDIVDDDEELPADLAIFLRPASKTKPKTVMEDDDQAEPVVPSTPKKRPQAGGGQRLALCIGIDDYLQQPLSGCVADAKLWASTLKGLGFQSPRMLLNADATRAGIIGEFRTMVQSAHAGDVLVIQYSGHGTNLPDLDGDEEMDEQDEALCPVDYHLGNFVIDDDVKAIFADLSPGVNLTCFFDCCHSGTITRFAARRTGRAMGVRGEVATPRFLRVDKATRDKYVAVRAAEARSGRRALRAFSGTGDMKEVVFSACRADQVAYESGGQGDFTRIATELLQSGLGSESHAAFQERIVHGFGSQPRQEPQLDCADAMRDAMLMAAIAAES